MVVILPNSVSLGVRHTLSTTKLWPKDSFRKYKIRIICVDILRECCDIRLVQHCAAISTIAELLLD